MIGENFRTRGALVVNPARSARLRNWDHFTCVLM